MSVSRKIRGRFDDGIFGRLIHPIGQVGLAPGPLKQSLDPAIIYRRFVAVKCVPGHAHNLAGFGYVAQLFGKVQQADFVFDDLLVSIQHCGFLVLWLVCTTIKTVTIALINGRAAPSSVR